MLRYVFGIMGSQFRQGALIHSKFVVTGSGASTVYTRKSSRPGSSHNDLTLVRDSTDGFLKLTLAGGAREISVLSIRHVNVAAPTDATAFLKIEQYVATDEAGGVMKFKAINGASTEIFANPAATDEVHVTLYGAK